MILASFCGIARVLCVVFTDSLTQTDLREIYESLTASVYIVVVMSSNKWLNLQYPVFIFHNM